MSPELTPLLVTRSGSLPSLQRHSGIGQPYLFGLKDNHRHLQAQMIHKNDYNKTQPSTIVRMMQHTDNEISALIEFSDLATKCFTHVRV